MRRRSRVFEVDIIVFVVVADVCAPEAGATTTKQQQHKHTHKHTMFGIGCVVVFVL